MTSPYVGLSTVLKSDWIISLFLLLQLKGYSTILEGGLKKYDELVSEVRAIYKHGLIGSTIFVGLPPG